ncbi:MAG: glycosyltransferase family 39 protein [Flavobacteriales bacterium]|nr:glycosyltransferase family 39 protein [Flavobacteriales bacterium]
MKSFVQGNSSFLYLALILCFYAIMGVFSVLLLEPFGLHFVRQTDSLSFASHYYHFGMDFFSPGLFNLQSDDAKAACEFPMLYYLTALIYQSTGEHPAVLRTISLLLMTSGFVAFFKTIYLIFKDQVYTLILGFWLISSTVLLYYSANFLPDSSAFALTLLGWHSFVKYWISHTKKSLYWSMSFFGLAALLKVTFFIHPLAIAAFLLITHRSDLKLFLSKYKGVIGLFFFCLMGLVLWNSFMIHYNSVHHDEYFLSSALPIWSLSSTGIAEVWGYISGFWRAEYYYMSTWHVFLVLLLMALALIKKIPGKIAPLLILMLLGSLSYFALFYVQFKDHDYYILNLFPTLFFLVLGSVFLLREALSSKKWKMVLPIALAVISVLSINYAHTKLAQRFSHEDEYYAISSKQAKHLLPYLDDLGIQKDDRLLIIGDRSPNGALLTLKRKGWTSMNFDLDAKELNEYKSKDLGFVVTLGKDLVNWHQELELLHANTELAVYKVK